MKGIINVIRSFLYNSLEVVYSIYFRKETKRVENIFEQRKTIDLFDYCSLSKEMPRRHNTIQNELQLYGTMDDLCKYANKNKLKGNVKLEHGLYLGGYTNFTFKTKFFISKHITFSDYREGWLSKKISKQEIIKIGPYIHYNKGLIEKSEVEHLKTKFGKTLIVFPSHSIPGLTLEYDVQLFLDEIDNVKSKHNFKTVIICFYFNDIIQGSHKQYESKGYKITCAGHKYDRYFLTRLKSIIELGDVTMSNKMGSHLGYCIYMNKPHYLFSVEVNYEFKEFKEFRTNKEDNLLDKELEQFNKEFGVYSETISNSQYKLTDYYFGFEHIKTKEELSSLDIFNR